MELAVSPELRGRSASTQGLAAALAPFGLGSGQWGDSQAQPYTQ